MANNSFHIYERTLEVSVRVVKFFGYLDQFLSYTKICSAG